MRLLTLDACQGFVEAKVLAKKFASLYFLLEDLLSPAKHYGGARGGGGVVRCRNVWKEASR